MGSQVHAYGPALANPPRPRRGYFFLPFLPFLPFFFLPFLSFFLPFFFAMVHPLTCR